MELQEFSPVQFYWHLGFESEPVPLIVDRRGEAAQRMREHLDLNKLNLEPTAAELTSERGDEKFRIGLLQIYGQISAFDDADGAMERIRGFLEFAIEFLKPTVDTFTFRTLSAAPTSSFEDLRDVINDRLVGDVDGLRKALGTSVSDSGWVLESQSGSTTQRLQFGPMKDDQLKGWLEMTEKAGPPEMLFLLTESRVSDAPPSSEILEHWARARDSHVGLTERTSQWLNSVVR